jgi:hypothetical protein
VSDTTYFVSETRKVQRVEVTGVEGHAPAVHLEIRIWHDGIGIHFDSIDAADALYQKLGNALQAHRDSLAPSPDDEYVLSTAVPVSGTDGAAAAVDPFGMPL